METTKIISPQKLVNLIGTLNKHDKIELSMKKLDNERLEYHIKITR